MSNQLHFDVIYSRDDNGWYAEVFDNSGATVHETILYPTRDDAVTTVKLLYPSAQEL